MSKEIEDLKKQIMWLQNQNASLFNRQEALRDHFAGLALQGLLASPVMGDAALYGSADLWIQDMTESAYEFANAMMAERVKESCYNPNIDIPIEELNLTVRIVNCLHAEKIMSVRDLMKYSKRNLFKTPNLGAKALGQIIDELAKLGLSL